MINHKIKFSDTKIVSVIQSCYYYQYELPCKGDFCYSNMDNDLHQKPKRFSKSQRPPKDTLTDFKPTKRQQDIIGFLAWLGVADASQLAMLLYVYGHDPEAHPNFKGGGGWRTRFGRDLRDLWWYSFINRGKVRERKYKLRADEIYFSLAQEELSPLHLRHRLERNEFLISLLLALNNHQTATAKKIWLGKEASFEVTFDNPSKDGFVTKKVRYLR